MIRIVELQKSSVMIPNSNLFYGNWLSKIHFLVFAWAFGWSDIIRQIFNVIEKFHIFWYQFHERVMTILSPGILFMYGSFNSHLLVDAAWYDHHESFQQLEQMLDKCKQLLVLLSRIFYHLERARRTDGLHVAFHFRPSSLCHRNLRLQILQKYLSHEELEDLVWIKKLNQSVQGRFIMVRTRRPATKQMSSIVTRTLKLRSWRSGYDDKYLTAFYFGHKFYSLFNIKVF